jgi:uroporphyrinogen III methyltransferase/synthase
MTASILPMVCCAWRAGGRILLLRAKDVAPDLAEKLKERRSLLQTNSAVYETLYEKPAITPKDVDAAVFTSASTVRGFKAAFPEMKVKYRLLHRQADCG